MLEIEAAIVVLAAGTSLLSAVRNRRVRLERWQNAALSCGLRVVWVSIYAAWRMKLDAGGGPLQVRIEAINAKAYPVRIVVAVPGPPGFSGVKIRRELEKPFGAREIEMGDESFDNNFYIVGPMRLVCALFDAETRGLLLRVNAASRLAISGGELRAELSDSQIPEVLPLLLDIGRRFAQPLEAPQRLAENARQDPAAGVRLSNLLLLIRELPGDPMTLDALHNACADPSPRVRLRAARELGAEGRAVLMEVAERTEDDDASAQAVSILGRELPSERTTAILKQALRWRHLQTARACLESLGRSGPTAVDTLAKVMAREQGELATAAAMALGETGSPSAEPPLTVALQREQADLRVAAASALGRVGSSAAVLPLKDSAERFSRDPELRRATRQAIAEIQSRLQGASPGQLSLSGGEMGQLSLTEAEAGQLSLATAASGQLSFPSAEPGQLSLDGEEPAIRPV
jgi:HEAT repeat protein